MSKGIRCVGRIGPDRQSGPIHPPDGLSLADPIQPPFLVHNSLYASPSDVGSWEEDILGQGVLAAGDATRVTIADGREQCEYDLRIVFDDGDVLTDRTDLCETGSYTVSD